jgi:excisionase family DNA binding protein
MAKQQKLHHSERQLSAEIARGPRLLSENCNTRVSARTRVPRFFTISDISKSLDVSTRTVRRWIKSGTLTAHHFGGIVRISEADFAAFLALSHNGPRIL